MALFVGAHKYKPSDCGFHLFNVCIDGKYLHFSVEETKNVKWSVGEKDGVKDGGGRGRQMFSSKLHR